MTVDFLDVLRQEGERLVATVPEIELDAIVPGLEWDARTVGVHTCAVHRWATDVVRRQLSTNETGGSAAFWPSGADRWTAPVLAEWLDDGLEQLLTTLTAAPPDLACFTFLPGVAPRSFWARRQAHETAIHRGDLESVDPGRGVPAYAPELAQDGLAELVGGFALEPGFASATSGSLLLRATDGEAWRVTFGGATNLVEHGAPESLEAADLTVTATSSELYRWAWNRPATVSLSGDPAITRLWRGVRIT